MKEAQEILRQLKQGNFKPIYFLQGEETFYIDLISDYIEDHAIPESEKSFNQVVLYGKDCDMNSILLQAKRFPMMAEKQVVIVKESQEIKDLNKDNGQQSLIDYVNNPLASTILVFAYKKKVLDGRKSLGKTLAKKATLLTSKKLYDNQIQPWIVDYVKEKGYSIGITASKLVADAVGNDLSKLSNELSKVFINLKEKEEINETHIEKNIGLSKDYNVFELNNALMRKNVLKANQIIQYFSKNPKSAPLVVIISNLYNTFSKLLILHKLKDKSDGNVASQLKVHTFFVKDYKLAVSRYPLISCVKIISFLRDADAKSKGVSAGSINEHDLQKELIFKILHV